MVCVKDAGISITINHTTTCADLQTYWLYSDSWGKRKNRNRK